ncbi:hypothetical protein D3C76_1308280 [compost metagenome]
MIPETDEYLLDESLDDQPLPSQTWKLDLDKGRIVGRTDGLDAIKQAVFKIFQTNRFMFEIYSFDYGHELTLLLGSSPEFVKSEATRMIQEALLPDDRIDSIKNVEVSISGEQITIHFTVITVYGSFEQEVSQYV